MIGWGMTPAATGLWLAMAAGIAVPPPVAAAARAIARSGARPARLTTPIRSARLTTPMRGVRCERFGVGCMWIVEAERMDDSSLCGTAGCRVQLWVALPRGRVALRFDQRGRAFAIAVRTTPAPLLRVDHHGSRCGSFGSDACPMAYRWRTDAADPPGRLAVEPPDPRQPLRAGPLIPAVRPDAHRIPTVVRAAIAAVARRCRARGGRPPYDAGELPDLDGDGRAEWSVDAGRYDYTRPDRAIAHICDTAPSPLGLLATAGRTVRQVHAAAGIRYSVSFAGRRPQLLVGPDAAGPLRPLTFDPAGGLARVTS